MFFCAMNCQKIYTCPYFHLFFIYFNVVQVTLSDRATLSELLTGVDIVGEGLGAMIDETGRRANVVVHFDVDWASVTPEAMTELYVVSCLC